MLLSLSTLLPSASHPTLSHSLHFLSPSSPADFTTPLFSPIPSEPERKLVPPCREFDLAIANLVAHHVDDLDGWMDGAVGLLRKGGWLVLTEFGKEEGGKDVAGEVRTEKEKERQEEMQKVKAEARAEADEGGEGGEVSGSHQR
jgi:SAM-dependent methyltransferase